MKVLICEDQEESRKAAAEHVRKWAEANGYSDVQITAFPSPSALLNQWASGLKADLLFLDIEFEEEMDGIALAREIRKTDENVPIVFITNYESYWRDGYEVNALRYLNKPVAYEKIAPCLDIARRRMQLSPGDYLTWDEGGKRIAVPFSEIVYLEAQSPYVIIRTEKESIRVRCRFLQLTAQNAHPLFVACHRSYRVNLLHIRRMTRTDITLSTGEVLPLSKNCADGLYAAFDAYYQGEA